jgi:hypothetical protein
MSEGTLWSMPGGHQAIEASGSSRQTLRLMVCVPGWPFPKPPVEVARVLCRRLPMRYYNGKPAAPGPDAPEALL